jgi:hypothetical protein
MIAMQNEINNSHQRTVAAQQQAQLEAQKAQF